MSTANVLQSYLIKLGVAVDRRGLDGFVGSVHSALSGMAKMGSAAVGAFGLVQVGVMKLAESEAALNDLSERVGATVEEVERFGYVASQSGSSAQALQSSMEGLSRMAGNAATGMAGAVKVFDTLRISATDSSGAVKDTTLLMEEIGQAISGWDKHSQRSILERLGIDPTLIKTLTTSTSELRAEFDDMAAAAGVDFGRTSKAASELMDEMGKTSTFSKLLGKTLGTGLMEDLTKGLRWGRQKIRENIGSIQGSVEVVVKVLRSGTVLVGRFFERLMEGFTWLHNATSGVSTVLLAIGAILLKVSAPVLAIGAALAGAFLLVDDLLTALEGGKTLLDWSPWLGHIRDIGARLDGLGQFVKGEFNSGLSDLLNWLDKLAASLGFVNLGDSIQEVKKALPDVITYLAIIVSYLGGGAWKIVKGAFGTLGDAVLLVLNILRDLGNFIENVLTGNFSAAFGDIESIVTKFDGFMDKTFGRIKSLVLGVVDGIKDAAGAVGRFLGITETPQGEGTAQTPRPELSPAAAMRHPVSPFSDDFSPDATVARINAMLQTRPMVSASTQAAQLAHQYGDTTTNNGGDVNMTNTFHITAPNASEAGQKVVGALEGSSKDISRYGGRRM